MRVRVRVGACVRPAAHTVNVHNPPPPHTHTQSVGGLPEADCGEGGEGGERRSHSRRSLGADVIFPAYIYIYSGR